MRIIPTRIHGILDYLVGAFLVVTPWAFGFWRNGAESWTPIWLGAAAILYSLLTNYELGVAKLLSMRTHLWLDFASGVLLALSPWIFRFSDHVYIPHVVLGLTEIVVVFMTDLHPYARVERGRPHAVHPPIR
ncbi:hypothetical protein KK062_06995 [Fulvivirgaceae bacterium PWU5]|uniref:SPW repeat-containing integral membrane domain-containing protein n=1 Tax=Dawidia cretensis TaxID=2782350 RepID=A0AAP2DUT4_9BACT|nr:SPW repeat protein [Dawidia cretensis]MBT1707960.1 hypothetical protein [Dawidia cretensis]